MIYFEIEIYYEANHIKFGCDLVIPILNNIFHIFFA